MVNWKDIHWTFTKKLQEEWENEGFNYLQTKEWINAGLNPEEAKFAYLLKETQRTAEEFMNNSKELEQLRHENNCCLMSSTSFFEKENWENIFLGFTPKLQKQWKELHFTYKQTKEWIIVGLYPDEAELASRFEEEGWTAEEASGIRGTIDDLREKHKLLNNFSPAEEKVTYEKDDENDWKNIHRNFFDKELIQRWKNTGFDYDYCKEWINIGLKPEDAEFAGWLRRKKGYTPWWCLTYGDFELLKEDYDWQNIHKDFEESSKIRENWERYDFNCRETKLWIKAGFSTEGYELAFSLKKIFNFTPEFYASIEKKNVQESQEWLETKYPKKEMAKKIEIDEFQWWLNRNTENLIISDYFQLEEVNINGEWSINSNINRIDIINCPQLTRIICNKSKLSELFLKNLPNLETLEIVCLSCKPADLKISNCPKFDKKNIKLITSTLDWLNWSYPKEKRINFIELNISWKKLKGEANLERFIGLEILDCHWNELNILVINDCRRLKKLDCHQNQITVLNITNLIHLVELNCSENLLTSLNFDTSNNFENLTKLNLSNNIFSKKYLSSLANLVNLQELNISHNQFCDNLKVLENLINLKMLDISHTDISEGLEYLSENLWILHIYNLTKKKRGVDEIRKKLKDYYEEGEEDYGSAFQKWRKDWKIEELIKQAQRILEEKEKETSSLEKEIQKLTELIKKQQEKIVHAYLCFASESEKKLLKELVTAHLQYTKFKRQATNSPSYEKECRKYERRCLNLKDQLCNESGEGIMNSVQRILTDCEDLADLEIKLERKINDESLITDIGNGFLTINKVNITVNNGYAIVGTKIGDNCNLNYQQNNKRNQEKLLLEPTLIKKSKKDWKDIHQNFNSSQPIEQWTIQKFTFDQAREWINIGLTPNDANFCAWLRDSKKLTAEWVLNYDDINQLRTEYQQEFQSHIEIPPKNN